MGRRYACPERKPQAAAEELAATPEANAGRAGTALARGRLLCNAVRPDR
jgi:hypothetical protein